MHLPQLSSSDWIAVVSLVVSMSALAVAGYAIYRGNRNTSAATLISLNVAFRQGWDDLLHSKEEARLQFVLAELMNVFEIACAIYYEKSLVGVSRGLLENYLKGILKPFIDSEYEENIKDMLVDGTTFQYIKRFMNAKADISVTVPPKWYEQIKKT